MTADEVIKYFEQTYPGKNIVRLPENNSTEIICEVDPTSDHRDYNVAVAAIQSSVPHFHKKAEELYEVLEGALHLKAGDKYTVEPNIIHSATSNFTLVKVTSHPGWTPDDHILA